VNVKKIDGPLLNFWVAKSAGFKLLSEPPALGVHHDPDSGHWHPYNFHPATDWSHAGPILSNEWFVIEDILIEWFGPEWAHVKDVMDFPLQWFMRAYVGSQFGDQVEDIATSDVGAGPSPVLLAQLQLKSLRALRSPQ
jgi:hypothetical protein